MPNFDTYWVIRFKKEKRGQRVAYIREIGFEDRESTRPTKYIFTDEPLHAYPFKKKDDADNLLKKCSMSQCLEVAEFNF